jgi:hypothetical protein
VTVGLSFENIAQNLNWMFLDWGLVSCAAADELVPEIQALEAQRTLNRLRPILEARGSTC